jgi:transketolase
MVGMAHHGGVLPFGGTFLVFSDYMRPSVRLAALSGAHVVFAWSHDSIGVGEDGPTHQPVEHLAALRTLPGLRVIRPADANETAQAWACAVDLDGPTAIVTSRQDLPVLEGTADHPDGVARGGYALVSPAGAPELVLVATGSEVSLCVDAAAILASEGRQVQVVSLPCWELFADQTEEYRRRVLPPVPTLSVEAGVTMGWERFADAHVGIDGFGASAPGGELMAEMGFTADSVADRARSMVTVR